MPHLNRRCPRFFRSSRGKLIVVVVIAAVAAAGALVPTAGSVWTTNLVQLDNGTCGTNLQIGSDPTASSSATPSFWLMGDGGLSSYQISIDGVLLGTFNSDGYGNVCIYTTVPLPDGPHQLTGVEQAPHAGNLVTPSPFTFTVDTVPPSVPSTPLLASFSDSGIRGDNITQYRSISFTGTCDPNGSMQLYEGTLLLGGAKADSTGHWTASTTSLADGVHQIKALAVDEAGNRSAYSAATAVTVDTAPPSNNFTSPAAGATVSGSVNVASNASDGVSMWKVDFQLDGVTKQTDTSSPYTWTWDTTQTTNGQHTLTTIATDAAGNTTTASETVTVQNGSATVPGAPTLNSTTPANNQVALVWTAPTSNGGSAITNYKVYRGTSSGSETLLTTLGNVTTYTDTSAANGTTYYYKISAVNAVGEGSLSNELSATPATTPGAPTLNSATRGNNQVALAWSPPASNGGSPVTNYKVYRGTSSGGETLLTTLGNVTTYTDSSAANGTTYYYKLSAVNSAGEGTASNELSATPATTPGAPTLNSATPANNSVALVWSPPASNGGLPVTNYRLYRGTSSGGETLLTTLANVTSYTDTGLTNGTTYYYKISAVNAVGEGPLSNELSATPSSGATPPGAPTLNTATPGNNSVALTWTAPASDGGSPVTSYKVYRGTNSGGETLLTTLGNVTTYTDTSAANGTTYYYKISAVNSVGEGSLSNELSATPATTPGAPTLNSATPGNGQVSLAWTAPASNGGSPVTNYKIYRGTASGGETLLTTLANVTSYTDTGLTNGTTYYYKVSAVNAVGEGTLSNERSATPATVPGAPTLSSATSGNGQVALGWTPPVSNGGAAITNYKLYRGTSSGGETLLTTLANVTSYTDTGLTNGTTYYYKVSAVNSVGEGTASNELSATPATTPGAPTLTSANPGNNSVTLVWTPPASNGGSPVTNYKVYRGTSSGGETLLTTLGNVTGYIDSSALNGTTYYYKVSAVNSVGEGSASNELSATPATTPGAATLNSATPGNNSVALTWTAPASNGGSPVTNYKVYRGTSSGGETLLTTVGNVTTYTDSSAVNGTTYYYKVSAVNAVGEGALSNEKSAAPATTPGAPTLNSATPGNGQVALGWTPPASNGGSPVTNYKVYRGTSSGGETLLTTLANVTSYTDTGLTNGTTYYYKVSAVNSVGEGAASNELSATPATVPGAPTLNSATPGNNSVALIWTAPASNGGAAITNYKLYRGTSSGGETLLTTLGNVTTYTDTSAANGTTYYYKVSAVNSVGEGAASNELSATPTTSVTAPGAPTLNSASGGNGNVVLGWSPPADDGGAAITNYKVYRGTSSGGETLLTTLGNVTSYTDTTAVNGTTYYYEISAVNSVGESAVSNELSAKPASVPGAPTLTSATGNASSITLAWTAPANNGGAAITNYKVYRGTSSGTETFLTTVGNVTGYTDTTTVMGVTYYYEVSAVNSVGEGTMSNELSAADTPDSTPPSTPTNLKLAVAGTSQLAIYWTPSTDNISVSGYDVYRNGVKVATTAAPNFIDSGLAAGNSYTYKVIARDAAGNSSSASTSLRAKTASLSKSRMTGTISGVVYNAQGRPASNVIVQTTVNGLVRSTQTSSSGVYTFSSLNPGQYTISVTGAQPFTATVVARQTVLYVTTLGQ